MFTIIDRYIVRTFLGYFVGGLLVFVSLFLAIDFMSHFSKFSVSTSVLVSYYLYLMPGVVYQMLPVACLIGTVFTISTLHRNNELVALFSAGMSLARISAPILVMVTLISAAAFWASDRLLPSLTQKKNYLYYVEIKKKPGLYSMVKTNKIWYRSKNILFNIKTLNPDTRRAQGITLYYFDKFWNLIQLISAREVTLKEDTWSLTNGTVTLFTQESSFPLTQSFKEKTIVMDEEIADLQSSAENTDVLRLRDLAGFIRKNKEAGLDTLRYEVDYHAKFGFAFAAFVMSILGIPFSLGGVRSGSKVRNIAMCVGVAFLYWTFYSSFLNLGRYGQVPPILAAWVPNLSMVGLSMLLLLRLKR